MIYELINPSDPYTFECKSREVAALTVMALSPMYGAKTDNEEDEIPIFVFGARDGFEKWYEENFGRTVEDGVNELFAEMADCLDSFVLGNMSDRKRFLAAVEAITDEEKLKEFKKKWQDSRSSMNDIGGEAYALAEKMKKGMNV